MRTEDEIRRALRQWIYACSKHSAELTDATPIIEQRIITSLQVMDLILYIEKLRGRRIEMDDLKPGVFRDINAIYESFFAEVTV